MTDVERELRALDRSAVFPATPNIEATVGARIAPRPTAPGRRAGHRWEALQRPRAALAIAMSLIAIAGVLMAASPGARSAVRDLLGLEGARIERGRPKAQRVEPPALGREVSLSQAERLAGFDVVLPDLPALGTPTRIGYDGAVPPSGQVSLAWRRGTPLTRRKLAPGVALVLTEVRATRRPVIAKVAPGATRIDPVEIDGEPGYWLTGAPHEIARLTDHGASLAETARLAGDTLIWRRGALLLRIEGAASKRAALAVARRLR